MINIKEKEENRGREILQKYYSEKAKEEVKTEPITFTAEEMQKAVNKHTTEARKEYIKTALTSVNANTTMLISLGYGNREVEGKVSDAEGGITEE
ncbi:hypothetical protein Z969_10430 [Clostridium novyi A str. 4570]|uniref:Uncharacterized protein n=1 Tax=Clostridium novyi A str. 4570 TaxID=1444290 RepID=A0AA88ZKC2_CLONO|nr:hypothetical protein [Clostridium novyi]KGM99782.1 hypothetical protein Z969_10430 [Clostridium novyi A str. 4570]